MDTIIFYLSFVPAVLWIAYFYYQDRYEKESFKSLAWVFILGCLSTIPAILIEMYSEPKIEFHIPFSPLRILAVTLMVGFAEEACKYYAVRKGIYSKPDFNEPMDGIVYGVTAAVGFAFVENIAYMYSFKSEAGLLGAYSLGVFRAIFSMFGHASFGVILGSYMGRAKFDPEHERAILWKGFIFASLVHTLYDFALMINRAGLIILPLLIAFLLMWRNLNRVHTEPFFLLPSSSTGSAPSLPYGY